MPDIKDVVGPILRAMSEAQDTANHYSADLAQQYGQDALLSVMSVPNALLSEVEIEIKYAVQAVVDEGPRPEQQARRLRDSLQRNSRYLEQALKSGSQQLQATGAAALPRGPALWRALTEQFEGQAPLPGGKPDAALLKELLKKKAQAALDQLLGTPRQGAQQLLVEGNSDVDAFAQAVTEDLTSPDLPHNRQVDIVVDSTKLQSLPREAISSIKVRARLRNYKWTAISDGEGEQDAQLLIREDD